MSAPVPRCNNEVKMPRILITEHKSNVVIIFVLSLERSIKFKIPIVFLRYSYSSTRVILSPNFGTVIPSSQIPTDSRVACWLKIHSFHGDKGLDILAA